MKIKYIFFILFYFSFFCLGQENRFLLNLDNAIESVKNYHTSKLYFDDVDAAVNDGLLNLQYLDIPKNPAFVFDVDETALSNIKYEIDNNFGYDPTSWDKWVEEESATAIPGVKRFYDSLIAKNISVIFITGRKDYQYQTTYRNLVKEGFYKFDTLICKSAKDYNTKAGEFKTRIRKELSAKYKIIGSIGDQWSDLTGGWTIIKIKIPNYMYYIE